MIILRWKVKLLLLSLLHNNIMVSVLSDLLQVLNVWATKFGLLLERKHTATDAQLGPPG